MYVSQNAYKRMTPEQQEAHDLAEEAERREARLEETLTRREIIEAIEAAMSARGGNCGDHHEADMETLKALRDAFE